MATGLGQMLVNANLITEDQLLKSLEAQKKEGGRLGTCLVKLNFITEDRLVAFLSKQYGIPAINLSDYQIDDSVVKLIPAEVAQKYQIMPVALVGATLTIAMVDPSNVFAIDDIKFMTGYNVEPVVAAESAIREILASHYEQIDALPNVIYLAGALFFAAYSVVSKPLGTRYALPVMMAYTSTIGAIPVILATLPAALAFDWARVSSAGWASLMWTIVMPVYVAWTLWGWVMDAHRCGPRQPFHVPRARRRRARVPPPLRRDISSAQAGRRRPHPRRLAVARCSGARRGVPSPSPRRDANAGAPVSRGVRRPVQRMEARDHDRVPRDTVRHRRTGPRCRPARLQAGADPAHRHVPCRGHHRPCRRDGHLGRHVGDEPHGGVQARAVPADPSALRQPDPQHRPRDVDGGGPGRARGRTILVVEVRGTDDRARLLAVVVATLLAPTPRAP